MSEKKNEDKVFDCTKFCKMTSTIRNSEYCTKESKICDGKVYFGCMEKLRLEDPKVQQYYKCLLWDMGLEDSCNTCMLSCINNKNKKMEKALEKKKELHKLIKQLEPNMVLYGITASEVEKISEKYANSSVEGEDHFGEEAIRAAKMAQSTLTMALKGRPIDLAFFGLYAEDSSKRLRKMIREKKKKEKK